jgi:hypothetical protein
MDFVHDQLATGRKIRVLTIVDTFSRFSPAVDPQLRAGAEIASNQPCGASTLARTTGTVRRYGLKGPQLSEQWRKR